MPWLRTYIAICAGVLSTVIVALILLVSFVDMGLSSHGMIALFLGTLVTIALTMVLMGLIFVSARHGRDASVHEAHIEPKAEEKPEASSGSDDRRSN